MIMYTNKFNQHKKNDNFIEKIVNVNRVSKVVKGGRRFGTAALVIVGNGKGKVGFGNGKAKEFPESIRKAIEHATKSMKNYPLKKNRTLHYDLFGQHGSGKVIINGKIGEVYHVSNVKMISIKELAELICLKMNKDFKRSTKLINENYGQDSIYQIDSKKIRINLSWKEKYEAIRMPQMMRCGTNRAQLI